MGPGCLASGHCPQWAAWSGGAPGVGKCGVCGELRRAAGPLRAGARLHSEEEEEKVLCSREPTL